MVVKKSIVTVNVNTSLNQVRVMMPANDTLSAT